MKDERKSKAQLVSELSEMRQRVIELEAAEEEEKRAEEALRASEDTLVDVRPNQEYRAGHIPGAVSVPVDGLENRLGELRKDQEMVVFCRGSYCVFAI